jgi:SAM-dependent methyltransferase
MQTHRPQALYRRKLLEELVALKPRRVLEVGCGGGGFLRSAAGLDAELHGIDPDESSLPALRSEGFSVELGRAERLDHPDKHFDAVVFCFTAHHIEDWHRAMLEAMRVGRAVLILDPWYETGICSQAVAATFDRWCKAIDRATGMVHNDCMSAERLLAPVRDQLGVLEIDINYLLVLHELGLERMLELASAQLRKAEEETQWGPGLDAIIAEGQLHGFSDDGAILLSVSRRNVSGRAALKSHLSPRPVTGRVVQSSEGS